MNCPHCDIEISVHPASRCLDAWLAIDVMGWQLGVRQGKSNISPEGGIWSRHKDSMEGVPYYSTNISAAWEVVEKLLEKDVLARVRLDSGIVRQWIVWASNKDVGTWASGETVPLAICRAAIKASQ